MNGLNVTQLNLKKCFGTPRDIFASSLDAFRVVLFSKDQMLLIMLPIGVGFATILSTRKSYAVSSAFSQLTYVAVEQSQCHTLYSRLLDAS